LTDLLYQTDSYIREFDATIRGVDEENHAVILDRSAFYPGGGGQPADAGRLEAGGRTYRVNRAKKAGDQVLHFLDKTDPLPAVGLPVQVNTTITRHNVHQVDALAELLAPLDIVLWSVFFLVPTGRATMDQRIDPETYEEVFAQLLAHVGRQPYAIKTTEAPHFRRFVLQAAKAAHAAPPPPPTSDHCVASPR
jgi:Ser-tRNA(Ala) deacylase AlaX